MLEILQGGKLFAATEAFLPFEIELSRERLRPIGFTTLGGMLEQKVENVQMCCNGKHYQL